MIGLDAATVLLQWAAGGLFFGWVTSRHREVGLGYGWLLRVTYGVMLIAAVLVGLVFDSFLEREVAAVVAAALTALALWQSVQRRSAGVLHQRELVEARTERVAAMTGIDRSERQKVADGPEFDHRLDLPPAVVALIGVVLVGVLGPEPSVLTTARLLAGAFFMGAVSDAMLLGHWYLVQPGLDRRFLSELVRWTGITWFPEVLLFLVPVGMASVLSGAIDDGWGGMLGWFWAGCAVLTIALVGVTVAALRERQYAAVMAATGLLYLAILTAFCTDLVARALLA